jgi:hypothetical protein
LSTTRPAFYYIRAEGFSVSDILNYRHKFGFIDVSGLTKSKVERGIRLLTRAGIVTPIGSLVGQTRYAFADKALRHMVGSSMVLHSRSFELLSKPWQYERKVNKQERQWLEKIYGQRQADRIISDYHDFLVTKGGANAMREEGKKRQYETEKRVLYLLAKKEAEELRQRCRSRGLERYSFPMERLIDEMILPPFLAASLGVSAEQKRKGAPPWRSGSSATS